jgi:hypothetical protein
MVMFPDQPHLSDDHCFLDRISITALLCFIPGLAAIPKQVAQGLNANQRVLAAQPTYRLSPDFFLIGTLYWFSAMSIIISKPSFFNLSLWFSASDASSR